MELQEIRLTDIQEGSRLREEYGDVKSLANSIATFGQIQTIAVKRIGESSYELVAGGRRLQAARILKKTTIFARVYTELSDLQLRCLELEENLQRKNLTWCEEAHMRSNVDKLYKELHGQAISGSKNNAQAWSMEKTAQLLGISTSTVSADTALVEAFDFVPELKKCKTRSEANLLLKKLRQHAVVEVHREDANIIEWQQKLIDAYQVSDFFVGAAALPDSSFDFIECDPPYGIDLFELRKKNREVYKAELSEYREVAKDEYFKFLVKLLKECHRVLKNNSWMVLWYSAKSWDYIVQEALTYAGFIIDEKPAIWSKDSAGLAMQPYRILASSYETFIYARKGDARLNKPGRNNLYNFSNRHKKKVHKIERPIELIEEVISTFAPPGSKILVPFLGSGTTLLAAANLKCEASGFDLSGKYKEKFVAWVLSDSPGNYKSYKELENV